MKNSIFAAIITISLVGCGSAPISQSTDTYDPSTQARIRIYGQNGKPTKMTYNIECSKPKSGERINLGGSLGNAFASMVGAVSNKSLGMPETAYSKNISEMNGVMSKAFFQEFAVNAGQMVSVQTAFIQLPPAAASGTTVYYKNQSCRSSAVSFVPQAGHDYEIVGALGAACAVTVYEVKADGSETEISEKDRTNPCLTPTSTL